jgi:2-polyprenyl-3-methyl-5-hydroxy-6-metoxy-1,4-benzoquinol methylase
VSNTVESYGWESTADPGSCAYISPAVLSILRSLNVKRVCDVGSGNGALVMQLINEGFSAVGIEHDQQGVERSRAHCPEVNFYQMGVQDDPTSILVAEGGVFDAVVSTEVVEHLFSPHLLPQFSRRLLPVGGMLIVSTPYHGFLKNLALSLFNKWDSHHTPLWHGGHIKFWSRATLTELLEQNGFKVVAFKGVGRLPCLWKSMILVARAV